MDEDSVRRLPRFGLTIWDVIYLIRKHILVVLAILFVGYLFYNGTLRFNPNHVVYAFVGAGAGLFLCDYLFEKIYIVNYRYLLKLDLEPGVLTLLAVPEARYKEMGKTGVMIPLTTAGGSPIYLVRNVDSESIDYGYYHEYNPIDVLSCRETYEKFHEDLTATKLQNLDLIRNNVVVGSVLAKKSVRITLDELSAALGLDREKIDDFIDLISGDEEVENEEDEQGA